MYKNSIRVCHWNVGGIFTHGENKLNDKLFLKEVQNHDLIILSETHVGYNTDLHIDGFTYFPVCRDISSNGRFYGGIGIFRKNSIKEHIKILASTSKDFQWMKIEKEFFNLPNDIYLCACYIPPSNSTYFQKLNYDIIESIETGINKYKDKGEIMICGDMNARTACLDDFIAHDDSKYLPLCRSYKADDNICVRNNRDDISNDRGKELIDFNENHQW